MKEKIKKIARELRKNQTEAEVLLWERLRSRKFFNKKILRQHPLIFKIEGMERFFIADFFCSESKLVIEVDGGIHHKQLHHDKYREMLIKKLGLQVVRVKSEVVAENLEYFLTEVLTPLLFPREGAGG